MTNVQIGALVRSRSSLAIAALFLTGMIALTGYCNARIDPVIRRTYVALPHWPAGTAPATVALISDLHLGNAAMDASRLQHIVALIDALHPDLILIAGDFVAGQGKAEARRDAPGLEAILGQLHAPLGIIAVLGNHDHETDPALLALTLRRANITVLANQAVSRGPLAIGGLDDPATERDRPAKMLAELDTLPGARLVIAHSPKPIWRLPHDGMLLLAGHTHCGQIVIPVLWEFAAKIPDFRCGMVRDRHRTTIVTAGLGTSQLPMRFGAPPDLWLLTLGPISPSR